MWFAEPVVRIVFARGAMNPQALRKVMELFQIALIGVPAVAVIGIASAALNAAQRTSSVFSRTAVCLAFFPVLALPGLLLGSNNLLMLAVVAFQLLLSVLLCRAAGLMPLGRDGWFTANMVVGLIVCLAISSGTAFIDGALALAPGGGNDLLRLGLAALGFTAALAVPNFLKQSAGRPL
jgi:peptidoglycan biosynthesis protein MviN/MurJ (putative lipid II flippase)